ncbi:MAG TPA: hypothetical protein VGT41_03680 [Candidatus Babeliales bacterium]|nr:hypothetical protein [Candidatus Babeliales bacterium]
MQAGEEIHRQILTLRKLQTYFKNMPESPEKDLQQQFVWRADQWLLLLIGTKKHGRSI